MFLIKDGKHYTSETLEGSNFIKEFVAEKLSAMKKEDIISITKHANRNEFLNPDIRSMVTIKLPTFDIIGKDSMDRFNIYRYCNFILQGSDFRFEVSTTEASNKSLNEEIGNNVKECYDSICGIFNSAIN